MITAVCQRWRDQRGSYRCAREVMVPRQYEVALFDSDDDARQFVVRHHYSRTYVAAQLRAGLYRGSELVGVAIFSSPPSVAALDAALPYRYARRAELGRLVLLDEVPANGESWFIARAFELARRAGLEAVVAHADPMARRDAEGHLVFSGHIGTVYQATNAVYRGLTPSRTWRIFNDGTVFSARAWSKLRARERGWRYVVELLIAHGAPAPHGDWAQWGRKAVAATTRPLRHRGTHRYVWALSARLRGRLPGSLQYPKFDLGAGLP